MWKGWNDIKRRKWIVNRGTEGRPEIDPFGIEEDEENEEELIDHLATMMRGGGPEDWK